MTDAEKGRRSGAFGWYPDTKKFASARSIPGGTRVSSRRTTIRWST